MKEFHKYYPNSWLFRILTFLIIATSAISGAIFLSIDKFVSIQFETLANERLNYQANAIKRLLDNEIKDFESLGKIIISDSDLIHSAIYNLYLEGESKHLEVDLKRVAKTFDIQSVTVWKTSGTLVASNSAEIMDEIRNTVMNLESINLERPSSLVWINEKIWIVTQQLLKKDHEIIGILQLARLLNLAKNDSFLFGPDARVELVSKDYLPRKDIVMIPVRSIKNKEAMLQLTVPDLVGPALEKSKYVVGITLLVSTILLSIIIIFSLRRQLRPIQALTRVAAKVIPDLDKGKVERVKIEGQAEVAQLVRAFNGMLDNLERIRKLEKELEQKERLSAIGKVATSVAHDINNPLTVIKNTAILLKDERIADQNFVQDMERIVHHVNRCTRTIDNLLRFGRPLWLNYEAFELSGFLKSYISDYEIHKKRSPIQFITNKDSIFVRGDRYQIEQLLDNLINNAFEANKNKEISIHFGKTGEKSIFVSIIDNGLGFSKDIQQSVFTPFFSTKNGGTGLGLSNSLAIANAHGGDIKITDAATGHITVTLPILVSY